jgi:hypothetical protein
MRGLGAIWGLLLGLLVVAHSVGAYALESIGPRNTDSHAVTEQRLAKEAFPYIVLVPGVLGSRIRLCEADSTCSVIWGDIIPNFNSRSLVYRKSVNYDVSLLENVAFIKVYAPFLNFARAEYGRFGLQDRIVTAPYDWRADVGRSAFKLNEIVCGIAKTAPGAKIVFFAHSMGGLVLKQWILTYLPGKCNGASFQIIQTNFVATPHLGAAKTVGALVGGYNFFLDKRDPDIVQFFQRLADRAFAGAINSAGLSFDGFFDLLPLLGTKGCHRSISPTDVDIVASGPGGAIVDLFDSQNWDTFELLHGHLDPGGTELALPELEKKLAEIRWQVCAVANLDPQRVADTKYVVGVLPLRHGRANPTSTVSRVHLRVRRDRSPDPEDQYSTGDGTVDARSASNVGIGTHAQRIITETSHIDTINSQAVRLLVRKIVNESAQHVFEQLRADDSLDDNYFVDRLSSQAALMPFALDPGKWNEEANAKAIRINRQILLRLKADPNNIYRENRERSHSLDTLLAMSLGAQYIDDNLLNKAGAFGRAAETAFVLGDYNAAQNYGAAAVAVADSIIPQNRKQKSDARDIMVGALNTIEKARYKLTRD